MLDSSVLVARWSRISLQQIAEGSPAPFVPVWSEWIIAETWRVLASNWRDRVGVSETDNTDSLSRSANRMLRLLIPVMHLVSLRDYAGPPPWPELRDSDDAPIWQTAVASGATYVVSHNLADFPPLVDGQHRHLSIEYLTAVEFIEDVLDIPLATVYDPAVPHAGCFAAGEASSIEHLDR